MRSFRKSRSFVSRALSVETVWLLFVTGGAAAAVACGSDAKPCEETQTCIPSTDGGEGGDDGQGGSSGKGGSAGRGGSSGKGGSSGAGNGGSGGADDEPPTVESITPSDGSSEVERDIEVTAELSEAIDEATVTETSITLEGPDGEVSGSVSVDENVISFVPERPLYLLGTYTFTIGDTVADLAGNRLAETASAEFQVRDGRWSEPTFPFGETVPRVVTQFQRNALGDVVLGMEIWPDFDAVEGAVFHAAEDQWTPATELRATARLRAYTPGVAIDDARRAVVTWTASNPTSYGWSRFTDEGGWVNSGALSGSGDVFVTPGGRATAVWSAGSPDWRTLTQDLSNGNLEPEAPFPAADVLLGPFPVASLERMALVYSRTTAGDQELVVSWKTASGWDTPELLASGAQIGSFSSDSDEQGNIIVVWRENDQIWSRVYQREQAEWTRELFVMPASLDAIVLRPDMTAGGAIVPINSFGDDPGTWVAVYQAGTGWVQDSIVLLDSEWVGGDVPVALDSAGNALAAWNSEIEARRYVAGTGWQPSAPPDALINGYYMGAAVAPDGTVLVASTGYEGDAIRGPWTIRFE